MQYKIHSENPAYNGKFVELSIDMAYAHPTPSLPEFYFAYGAMQLQRIEGQFPGILAAHGFTGHVCDIRTQYDAESFCLYDADMNEPLSLVAVGE